ncbi:hypothetical protein PP175_27200 (plasmid) [Aneurinibacillus sp. Ricciae_BoGa-3]|uniref:hypothetical protein n=1 Tax=Aneurinibacillus sp. Ricciae_BoGa-3 TaxID=3022697 RepID=UPI0023401850|nr:hypothetical protein [Aneurinibacillus sp. Ricciae_BoGa-3]WCK57726.1 hypothetical protein PP175_27200 [Aneurinibacillus sp. Ricciae_BoGa-3]
MNKFLEVAPRYVKYMPVFLSMFLFFTVPSFAQPKLPDAWKSLMDEYHIIIQGIIGFGILTALLVFIMHMIHLASLGASNPKARRVILNNILISGITTAMLGAVEVIFSILVTTAFGK